MYYGLEEPVAAPKVAIWDMQPMMQYISLLKDNYDKTQERLDKFAEKYGDFYSPLAKDNENWNKMTVGAIQNGIDDIYASGEDPFRSVAGRAKIQQLIRSVNTPELSRIKASAPIYQEYIKNRSALIAAGKYDPELERIQFGGISPDEWDSASMGVLPYSSPVALKSLQELTTPSYEKFAPQQKLRSGNSTEPDRKRLGSSARFTDIYGVRDEDKAKALADARNSLSGTDLGTYYMRKAQRIADNLNEQNPNLGVTADQVLNNMIEDAQAQRLQEKDVKNDIAMDMWKEGQANYRASLRLNNSNSGNGNKHSSNDKDLYSAMIHSIVNKLNQLNVNTQANNINYKDGNGNTVATVTESGATQNQGKYYNWAIKQGGSTIKRANRFIDKMSGTYDEGQFATMLGRKPVDGSNSTVFIHGNDLDKLYTAEELMMTSYRVSNLKPESTKIVISKGKKVRNSLRNSEEPTMSATGKMPIIRKNDGNWYTYREVYVPALKQNLYYEIGYRFNEAGGKIQPDETYNASTQQQEIRAKDYASQNAKQIYPN